MLLKTIFVKVLQNVVVIKDIAKANLYIAIVGFLIATGFGIYQIYLSHEALRITRDPFPGEAAFLVKQSEDFFDIDKARTEVGGILDIYLCQQGLPVMPLREFSFLEREEVFRLTRPEFPYNDIDPNIATNILINIYWNDDRLSTVFYSFDTEARSRLNSKYIDGINTCPELTLERAENDQ